MSNKPKQCCAMCSWTEIPRDKAGRIRRDNGHYCLYPQGFMMDAVHKVLPSAAFVGYYAIEKIHTGYVRSYDGQDCPCYKPKEDTNGKA